MRNPAIQSLGIDGTERYDDRSDFKDGSRKDGEGNGTN